ncbi:MAG: hypothetical protein MZV64_71595 [Ignavibacteriales bacterium]|nr:hypothetical protein [Ignavibacteriales bacterium]
MAQILVFQRRVLAGIFVEEFGFIRIALGDQPPPAAPALDGGGVNTQLLGEFILGERKPSLAQPPIAAFQSIISTQTSDHLGMQRAACSGVVVLRIEPLGHLGIGVILQQAVDLGDERRLGLGAAASRSSPTARSTTGSARS